MKKEIPVNAYKCKKCGKMHYPLHERCLECKGREFETVPFGQDARLLTYTTIYNLPWGFDQRYLIIGVAEFENGARAMGQIACEDCDPLEMGMAVKVHWGPVRVQTGENVYGFKFEPVR